MSDTATFCATCGARVLTEPPPTAEAPPASAVADSAPLDADGDRVPRRADDDLARARVGDDWVPSDAYHEQEPLEHQSVPAPETPSVSATPSQLSVALANPVVRIVIAALAIILVNAILAAFVHAQVSALVNSIPRVSMSDYRSIQVGQTVQQVEASLGGPTTSQAQTPGSTTGTVVDRWTNSNGSYVTVTFVNGVVSILSESGLERARETSSTVRLAGYFLYPIQYIDGWMAAILCLYVATLLTGYRLTVKQIIVLGLIMSAVGLVLAVILRPLGLVGIPIYLVVYVAVLASIIMAWTGASGGDALLIIIGSWVIGTLLERVSGVAGGLLL